MYMDHAQMNGCAWTVSSRSLRQCVVHAQNNLCKPSAEFMKDVAWHIFAKILDSS